jgi:hypothetical protein
MSEDCAPAAKIFKESGNKSDSSATFHVESQPLNLGRRSEFLAASYYLSRIYSVPLKIQVSACVGAIRRQAFFLS